MRTCKINVRTWHGHSPKVGCLFTMGGETMNDSTLIADLIRAGVNPDLVQRVTAALIEAHATTPVVCDPSAERRREKDRERKAALRAHVCGIPQNSAESADKPLPSPSLSLSLLSPTPPFLSHPHTPSPASAHVREELPIQETKPSKPAKKPNLANDEDWLKTLEADPTYTGIEIRKELGKMQQWCLLKRKQPSRSRFLNWIGRAEKTLAPPASFSFPLTSQQREIATWFGRNPDDWTVDERSKWDSLPMLTSDDFQALKWLYTESGYGYLRQTLPSLLQNWRGEIDKAKNYDPNKP